MHACAYKQIQCWQHADTGALSACFKSSTFGEIISLPQYMTVKISINIIYINK